MIVQCVANRNKADVKIDDCLDVLSNPITPSEMENSRKMIWERVSGKRRLLADKETDEFVQEATVERLFQGLRSHAARAAETVVALPCCILAECF